MKILELNHVAIHAADVERSMTFYRDVLKLEMLPRPAFDFPGAWFRLGMAQELHLIGRRGPVTVTDGNNHFALRVDDIVAWEKHLRAAGAEFVSRCVRTVRRKFSCVTRTGISSNCFHFDRRGAKEPFIGGAELG